MPTNTELIAQARAQLAQMDLSEKCYAFLQKAFEVLEDKPMQSIEVVQTYRGAKFTVYFVDGDERTFEAARPNQPQ